MKWKETVFANAAAAWMTIVYVLCALSVALFPGLSRAIAVSWFHGIDLAQIWSANPFPGNFWLGLVSAVVLTWPTAWLFAWLYNRFSIHT